MAKICPYTGEKVLYLDCLECEDKGKCSGKLDAGDDLYNVSTEQKDKLLKKLWHYIQAKDIATANTVRNKDDIFDEMDLSDEERCYLVFRAD